MKPNPSLCPTPPNELVNRVVDLDSAGRDLDQPPSSTFLEIGQKLSMPTFSDANLTSLLASLSQYLPDYTTESDLHSSKRPWTSVDGNDEIDENHNDKLVLLHPYRASTHSSPSSDWSTFLQ